jgi:pectinesterase
MKQLKYTLLLFSCSLSLWAQTAPDVTLVVSKDSTSDFSSIQEAIMSVRAFTNHTTTIHIKEGVYFEKIQIPAFLNNLILEGEGTDKTIIVNDDYSGKIVEGKKLSTFNSYTLLIHGDQNQLKNLTVKNTSCNQGQAVALHVIGDEFQATNVNLIGCQDTLYTGGPDSRQYFKECYIEGTTDFIFGSATVFFENCIIKSKKNSFVTAASTPEGASYGYVFDMCEFVAEEGIDKVYLGRPWRPFAQTVMINCQLGAHILPLGWDPWKGDKLFPNKELTTYYGEYKSQGPGANPAQRVNWSHQLTEKEFNRYTLSSVLQYSNWKIKR